jgi:hypothetical protein
LCFIRIPCTPGDGVDGEPPVDGVSNKTCISVKIGVQIELDSTEYTSSSLVIQHGTESAVH